MPKVAPEYLVQARRRIVEAARSQFGRQGYRATSMEAVARAVGVTKGALYRYFRSKSDLLLAVQDATREEAGRAIASAVRRQDLSQGFVDLLSDAFKPEGRATLAFGFDLLSEAYEDAGVRRAILEDHRGDTRMLRELVHRLQRERRVPSDLDPDTVAFVAIALSLAAGLRLFLGYDRDRTLQDLRRAMELVLRAEVPRRRAPHRDHPSKMPVRSSTTGRAVNAPRLTRPGPSPTQPRGARPRRGPRAGSPGAEHRSDPEVAAVAVRPLG